ncbi:hypothetical protein Dimus_028273 [Dionaea muscipula]
MMRMKAKLAGLSPKFPPAARGGGDGGGVAAGTGGGGGGEPGNVDWELRPGGMLVQKRSDSDQNSVQPPTIRVRVKHGSIYHEISISCQATFGELKKKLQGPTGLHHQGQKLLYKDKERDSNAYLDMVGVKDKSKIVLIEDPISQEKRYLEMRRNSKMEKAARSISEISLEVDRLAVQVSALESVISRGGKVEEKEILSLTELLMTQLIKLDAIVVADGEVKLQRKMQVRRVQKYVEALDIVKVKNSMAAGNGSRVTLPSPDLKVKNSMAAGNGSRVTPPTPDQKNQHKYSNSNWEFTNGHSSNGHNSRPSPIHRPKHYSIGHSPLRPQQQEQEPVPPPRDSTSAGTVVTTQWETFDSGPPLIPAVSNSLIPSASSSATVSPPSTSNHKFNWEIF